MCTMPVYCWINTGVVFVRHCRLQCANVIIASGCYNSPDDADESSAEVVPSPAFHKVDATAVAVLFLHLCCQPGINGNMVMI